MQAEALLRLLIQVAGGSLTPDQALKRLARWPTEDVGFAKIDHHRHLRQGFPEVVYAPGKTTVQLADIVRRIHRQSGRVLVTRVEAAGLRALRATRLPLRVETEARCVIVGRPAWPPATCGTVAVVTAGTADLPVAEEAAVAARLHGARVERIYDAGVAGLHRLLPFQETLQDAACVVVAAGMEGALASVVGGLTARPVVAVPTSVGYGAAFGGVAALLAMLNACAPNVAVMNIDDGFGAGFFAGLVARGQAAVPDRQTAVRKRG